MRFDVQRRFCFEFVLTVVAVLATVRSDAVDYTWTGGGGNGYWNTANNWTGGVPASASDTGVSFPSSGTYYSPLDNNISNPFSLRKLTFGSGGSGVSLAGNGLSFNTASTGAGIYKNSASNVTIANALSWSGASALNLNCTGAGDLTLTGGLSASGSGGTVSVGVGSVVLSSTTNTFVTGSNGKLLVGYSGPTTLTIENSTSVTVGGELDVNYQVTRAGDTSNLELQSGSLSVTGPTVIGAARMEGADYSAKLLQTGGSATFTGLVTVGKLGTAKSLYDISGGTMTADNGMEVGRQGNGALKISGSSGVTVAIDGGLKVGLDSSRATSGQVEQTGGALSVSGNLTLGDSGGIGTLSRSGGTWSVTGDFVVGGTGTLILNNCGATSFGGTLSRPTSGTLVVVPYTPDLGSSEKVRFGADPLPSGASIVGPWVVQQVSGSSTSGEYLTTATDSGYYRLSTYSAYHDGFSGAGGTSIVSVGTSSSLGDDMAIHALKVSATATIGSGKTLTIASGGIIVNGGTIQGGTVHFADENADVPAMIFAGSSTAGTISSPLKTEVGLVKFGPGTVMLSGDSGTSLTGEIIVSSGVLNAQHSGALGAGGDGNGIVVATGAGLELQGGFEIANKCLTLSGTGKLDGSSNPLGALRNVSDNNSWIGPILLAADTHISVAADSLTLAGPLVGNRNLTKVGDGTLVLAADNSGTFTGSITVSAGTLTAADSGALGLLSPTSTVTVASGAALALKDGIDIGNKPLKLSGTGVSGGGALKNLSDFNSFAGPITLAASTQITCDSDILMLTGPISGTSSATLTKTGDGTLVLYDMTSSYSGTLTVAAGTLSIPKINGANSPGPLGKSTNAVVLGTSGGSATLEYTGGDATSSKPFSLTSGGTTTFDVPYANLTLSGAISSSGNLTKAGDGTLTLSGNASYSGNTIVSRGTLAIASTSAINSTASITVEQGATLRVTGGSSEQLRDAAGITLNGGNLNMALGTNEIAGDLVLGVGHSNITTTRASGSGTPSLCFANGSSHTVGATVNYSSTNSDIRFLANPPALTDEIMGGYSFFGGSDFATRTNSGSPYTISALSTYSADDTSDPTKNFRPTSTTTISSDKTYNSLNLTGSLGVTIASGSTLTLDTGGLIANTDTGTISGGTLKGSASGELVVNTVQSTTVSSVIADNGGATVLVKTGPATLTLTGANTYTGNTYLNQGTVEYAPANDLTYAQVISGAGNLKKSGSAKLTLSGANTYTGTTTVTAGTLWVTNSLAAETAVTLSGGTLGGTGTIYGNVTASGGDIDFSQQNYGRIDKTLTVTGDTTWMSYGSVGQKVDVISGTLTIGTWLKAEGAGVEVSGTGELAVSNASSTIEGHLTYMGNSATFTGVLAGTTSCLEMNSNGATFTLGGSNSNTYGGGTTVTAGTLKLAKANALGSGALTVGAWGTLDLNGQDVTVLSLSGEDGGVITDDSASGVTTLTVALASGTSVYNGAIIDGADRHISLEKSGSGTLVLTQPLVLAEDVTVSDNGSTLVAYAIVADTLTIGSGASVVILETSTSGASAAQSAAAGVPEPSCCVLLAGLTVCGILAIGRRLKSARRVSC